MASGAPVVASDLAAFSDLLRTGPDRRMLGELFAEGDPAALAEAAIRMLNHPDPTRTAAAPPGRPALRLVAGRAADPRGLRGRARGRGTGQCPRRRIMIIWSIVSVLVIILLIIGWRLSWLATRVDRANARTESTWAALDAALVRRAQRAAELAPDRASIRRAPCWSPTRPPRPSNPT